MKRILMFVFIALFAISIAIASLMCIAAIGAVILQKFKDYPDTYMMGIIMIPVVVFSWIAWLSPENTKKIRNILYGERDSHRNEV